MRIQTKFIFTLLLSLAVLIPATSYAQLSEAELQDLRDETAELVPEPFVGDLSATGAATDEQLTSEWVRAFVMMTGQFNHMMVQQVQAIGKFFDAKHQLETQQLFQQRVAEAHKDYHPSEQICEIGTFVRDLADAEERTKITRNVIAQAPLSRELGSGLVKTFNGIQESDARTRRDLYRNTFCNIYDNAQNNELICGTTPGGPGGETQSSSQARLNADLNYTQTIDLPLTLNVDFTDGETSDEETNIFAMLDQIFMNTPFPALRSQKTVLHNFVKPYQEMRSLIAIRSVAQNSFAHIIAEKTIGAETENSITPFIYALLEEMGMDSYAEGTIAGYLGERPSYYAQMEVLTKKIFQHPEFISNLYDKPANVKRIKTALNAIKLMQDRDIQQAMMRREMLTSMVLELRLRKRQNKLSNQVEGILSQPPGEAIDIYGVSEQSSGETGDGF